MHATISVNQFILISFQPRPQYPLSELKLNFNESPLYRSQLKHVENGTLSFNYRDRQKKRRRPFPIKIPFSISTKLLDDGGKKPRRTRGWSSETVERFYTLDTDISVKGRGAICLIAGYYDFRKIIARQSVGNGLIMRNYFHTFCDGGQPAGIKYS